uniref:Transmembrane protein 144 n=1 Tax=Panagrellus redivivus TaxID=6233 RepID=A0A7E4VZK1_PANRE
MSTDAIIGFVSLIISCLGFGFMFAPLRKYDCKDGFFVQWVQCAVVFLFGVGIQIAQGMPKVNLLASVGGILYATGNVCSVPIVKGIGIGLGMLIWGSIQITIGWCIARFGMFGTKVQEVQNDPMNYAGLVLTIVSGIMFVFVKSEENESTPQEPKKDTPLKNPPPMDTGDASNNNSATSESTASTDLPSVDKKVSLPKLSKTKIICIAMSVALGILHGFMMTPIVYIQDTDSNASQNVLDYVFSHYCGVFTFSTLYFFAYTLVMRGKPYIHAELVLPSILYGILWSVAMVLFFISNHKLSQTVSYPITARLPAIIGALTDVFFYKSIKGKKNLAFLGVSVSLGIIGVVLVGLSNNV